MTVTAQIQLQTHVSTPEFRGIETLLVKEGKELREQFKHLGELTSEELYNLNSRSSSFLEAIQEAQR